MSKALKMIEKELAKKGDLKQEPLRYYDYDVNLIDVDRDRTIFVGKVSLPAAHIKNSVIIDKAMGAIREFLKKNSVGEGWARVIHALTHSAIRVDHFGGRFEIVHAKSGTPLLGLVMS